MHQPDGKSRSIGDLVVAGLTCLSVGVLFYVFELHDWWHEYSRKHEHWEFDELIGLVLGALVGTIWFALRRLSDSRRQLQRQRRLEQDLQRSEAKYRDLTDGSIQGIYVNRAFELLYVNHTVARLFGYETADEVLALGSLEHLLAEEEVPRLASYAAGRMRGEAVPGQYEFRGRKRDGSFIWLHNSVRVIEWDDGPAIQSTLIDVTARKAAEDALTEAKHDLEMRVFELENLQRRVEAEARRAVEMSEELADAKAQLQDAIDSISEGFALWDVDDRLLMCNSPYRQVYAALQDLLVPGMPFEDFVRSAFERGVFAEPEGDLQDAIKERVARHRTYMWAFEHELADGRWVRVSKRRSKSGRIVGIVTDISDSKASEETIRRMAQEDTLTGLPNRAVFHGRLKDAVEQAARTEYLVGVMLLDLDHFKRVNDSLGHPAGDELLCQVSGRLLDCLRKTDTVARLGGDEFGVIVRNAKSLHSIARAAQRIVDSLAQPFTIEGQEIHSGGTLGITIYPQDKGGPDLLLRHADLALYRAKEAGRGSYQIFSDEMNQEVLAQRAMEADLRRAIEREEFYLAYQPRFDISSGEIVGAEALLRWNRRGHGNVSPGEFIPVAELTRTIVPIEDWVLRTVCAQSARWQAEGLPALTISINISPLHFRQENFVDLVKQTLTTSELEPRRLEIEVTEGLAMDEKIDAKGILSRMAELGCRIAIDDFGTGYSSLNRLHQFPVDRLKIDQSFVRDITEANENAAICATVIRLGHSLNIRVTAEGLETEEQFRFLVEHGCDEVQGFLFGRPMPAESFEAFVREHDPSKIRALAETMLAEEQDWSGEDEEQRVGEAG